MRTGVPVKELDSVTLTYQLGQDERFLRAGGGRHFGTASVVIRLIGKIHVRSNDAGNGAVIDEVRDAVNRRIDPIIHHIIHHMI